jgi:flagellar motility protein MotE (MotC chaperone)
MFDSGALISILPPVLAAVFAYLVARKKNLISEKISSSKIDSEIQSQALVIVRSVMADMRDELRVEIDILRKEKDALKKEIHEHKSKIENLQNQFIVSNELAASLRSEVSTLQAALNLYKSENERLRNR